LAATFTFSPKPQVNAAQLNMGDMYGGPIAEEEVDFKTECEVYITDGKVEVYYKGQQLQQDVDYWVNKLEQKFLKQSVQGVDGDLNTYDVVTYYSISGKGKFKGGVNKTTTEIKTIYERNTR
jgi:hypothetical protein